MPTSYISSQVHSLYFFYSCLLIYSGLGVGGGVLVWVFGFQLMGFGACGVGPSGFLGLGLSM